MQSTHLLKPRLIKEKKNDSSIQDLKYSERQNFGGNLTLNNEENKGSALLISMSRTTITGLKRWL